MREAVLQLRGDAVEWRRVDDEVVALHLESSLYLAVNATGRLLWEPLAEGATHAQLVERLRDAHGLDADRARADVDAFLAGLREHGLLADRPAP
jgi:hypothetical protein